MGTGFNRFVVTQAAQDCRANAAVAICLCGGQCGKDVERMQGIPRIPVCEGDRRQQDALKAAVTVPMGPAGAGKTMMLREPGGGRRQPELSPEQGCQQGKEIILRSYSPWVRRAPLLHIPVRRRRGRPGEAQSEQAARGRRAALFLCGRSACHTCP